MFERYTESARRTLFFSRYEATQHGSTWIESQHVLLGILREEKGVAARVLAAVPIGQLREQFSRGTAARGRATAVEIPFSAEAKRVLQHAADEADGLQHRHIGTEHLLLGLLREERSAAGAALIGHGLQLGDVRRQVGELAATAAPDEAEHHDPKARSVTLLGPAVDLMKGTGGHRHLQLVAEVLDHFAQHVPLDDEGRELVARMQRDVAALQARLPPH
jgi:ATP-dependent Clp protease ATP-binding subunit ClpC